MYALPSVGGFLIDEMGHVTRQPLLVVLTWYPIMWSSLCNSFEDWAPVDFIYVCAQSSYELHWFDLTHWGRVTHICVGNLTIIGPDNGLSPGRRQAIIWTNAGILLIGPWGTNFNEILIGIHKFSFKKINFKMSSAKWHPFCLSLNVLKIGHRDSRTSNGHQSDHMPNWTCKNAH